MFRSDWVSMDSEFQNAMIHIHCQTISPLAPATGYRVKVESSFDTVETYQIGSTSNIVTTGSFSTAVTSNIGPMVRLVIENPEAFAMVAMLSVWLQAKSA